MVKDFVKKCRNFCQTKKEIEIFYQNFSNSVDRFRWITVDCETEKLPFVCEIYPPSECWVASDQNSGQWLQVDLGKMHSINGVVLQGNPVADEYVKSFKLAFSDDGQKFKTYLEQHPGTSQPSAQKFEGNVDGLTPAYGFLRHPVTAQYVRILPHSWETRIAVRLDVIGCADNNRID